MQPYKGVLYGKYVWCIWRTYPTDLSASVKNLYPAAKAFETYLAPVARHGLNVHYSAEGAFSQIQTFLKNNGL